MIQCQAVLTVDEDVIGRLAPLRTQHPTLHQPAPQLTQPTRQWLGLEIIARLACYQMRQQGSPLITTRHAELGTLPPQRRSNSAQPCIRTSEAPQLASPDLDPRV